jgi:hypothetical protein
MQTGSFEQGDCQLLIVNGQLLIMFGLTQAELVEAGFDKLSLRKFCLYTSIGIA